MLKLERDLEDTPGHGEFLKFFKAILFFFSFNKSSNEFFSGEKRPQTIPEFANIIMSSLL